MSPPRDSTQRSLADKAYAVLRRAIREGDIQTDRHYSESELAELLGVSRTPVREALKALEREGVLSSASTRGYRLRSFTEEEIAELIDLRTLLEDFAIRRLAAQAGREEVRRLESVVERQAAREAPGIFALDEEFHLLIAELAGLDRTRDTLAALRSAMAIINAGATVSDADNAKVIDAHRSIVEAVAAHEPAEAAARLRSHIDDATSMLYESARRRARDRTALRLDP